MTFDLEQASTSFAQEVQDLLDAVLPIEDSADPETRRIQVIQQDVWFVVRPGTRDKPGAVPLLSDGVRVADLTFHFHCHPDRAKTFLAVRKSKFQLVSTGESTPLLRLDFDQNAHTIPTSHWNVHGERGATSVLLARCNRSHPGLLAKVHLPVGGVRYRPCLEDFLEMLVTEFGFDRRDGWKEAVLAGREQWRIKQVKAIVRDHPEAAADVLENLGYQVSRPAKPPERNVDVLRAR